MANTSDIRPLGAGAGIGYYWIKEEGMLGGYLILIAINELGEVTRTGLSAKYEPSAPTRHEAVVQHLGSGIAQADSDLERRRQDAPEPEPQKPIDEATRRFLGSG